MARVKLSSLSDGTALKPGTFLPALGSTAMVYTHDSNSTLWGGVNAPSPATVYQGEIGGATLSQPLSVDANAQLPGWLDGVKKVDIVYTSAQGVPALPAPTDSIAAELVTTLTGNTADDIYPLSAGTGQKMTSVVSGGSTSLPLGASTTFLPLPTGVATTDTANLNAVLARAGRIQPNPLALTAIYSLTAPLVVPANTDVDFGGCTFTLTGQFNMLQNAAVQPAYTATDASTSVGSSVVASATLAPHATAGMALAIVGAGANGGTAGQVWLYGTVLSVAGNNITLTRNQNGVAASVALSGATAYLFNRDALIKVQGGTFDSAAVWNALTDRQTAGFNSHLIRLRRVDGLTVRRVTVKSNAFSGGTKGWSFGINPGDCTDVLIEDITGNNSSTTVQGDGPLSHITVRNIRGTTQDDMVAFGCVSFGGNDVEGDITGLEISGIHPNNSWTALKLFAGQGGNGAYRPLSLTARTIKGTTQRAPVNIVDYAGHSWVDALIEDVEVTVGSSSYPLINITAAAVQHITLKDIVWPYNAPVATNGVISCGDHVPVLNIENLTVRGSAGNYVGVILNRIGGKYNAVTIDGVFQPDSTLGNFNTVVLSGGTVDLLTVSKIRQTAPGTIVYSNGGDQTVLHISDGYQDNAASVIYSAASATAAVVAKIARFTSVGVNAVIAGRPMTVFFDSCDLNASGAVVSALGVNATPIRVLTQNVKQYGAGNLVIRDGTQIVNINGHDVGVDAAILTPADQDIVLNNNGLAGWPQGVLIYNASSGLWRGLSNQAGIELGYAEITANQTGISTVTDITGLSITFTAPVNGKAIVRAWCTGMQQQTSTGLSQMQVTDSANTVKATGLGGTQIAGNWTPAITTLARLSGLTPGTSYTFKVRALTGAGTVTFAASATQRAFIQAIGV